MHGLVLKTSISLLARSTRLLNIVSRITQNTLYCIYPTLIVFLLSSIHYLVLQFSKTLKKILKQHPPPLPALNANFACANFPLQKSHQHPCCKGPSCCSVRAKTLGHEVLRRRWAPPLFPLVVLKGCPPSAGHPPWHS